MKLISIRALPDASIFCKFPSIVGTFVLEDTDQAYFDLYDDTAQKLYRNQLLNIGIDIVFKSSSENILILLDLARYLIENIMHRLDLYCGDTCITYDKKSNRIHMAFPEKNRILTSIIINQSIRYVMSLYNADQKAKVHNLSISLDQLKYILKNAEKLSKASTSQTLHNTLIHNSKPWFSLDFDQQHKNWIQLGFGRQQKILDFTTSFNSSYLGIRTSLSKIQTCDFLAQLGFSVPQQMLVQNVKQAIDISRKMGFPVVLKSDVGTHGSRVYSDLRIEEEVAETFNILQKDLNKNGLKHTIFIEKFIKGKVYRVEVINGKFFDAYQMIPAGIIGDGIHTVKELVDIENQKSSRGSKKNTSTYVFLELNTQEVLMLKKQNMTIDCIPKQYESIQLRANSNWSSGGTFEKVSDLVHQDNKHLAERIATALKIDLAGIDIITDDISRSFIDRDIKIIEVNHSPAIDNYYDDRRKENVDVINRLIGRMIPNITYGDVPVIMFKSTDITNKSEILLEGILNKLAYSVGLINKQGLFIDGKMCAKPEHVNYQNPGLQILRNDTVGAAIIDRTQMQLADFGLGSGGCDISIILESKDENIVTPLWSYGLGSQKVDHFLCLSARLASIILVNNTHSMELCKRCSPEKLFVLYQSNMVKEKYFLERNVNRIKLLQHNKDGLLLYIIYNQEDIEKFLNLTDIRNPIPYLAVIATLLVLNLDIEKIFTLLEAKNQEDALN